MRVRVHVCERVPVRVHEHRMCACMCKGLQVLVCACVHVCNSLVHGLFAGYDQNTTISVLPADAELGSWIQALLEF